MKRSKSQLHTTFTDRLSSVSWQPLLEAPNWRTRRQYMLRLWRSGVGSPRRRYWRFITRRMLEKWNDTTNKLGQTVGVRCVAEQWLFEVEDEIVCQFYSPRPSRTVLVNIIAFNLRLMVVEYQPCRCGWESIVTITQLWLKRRRRIKGFKLYLFSLIFSSDIARLKKIEIRGI